MYFWKFKLLLIILAVSAAGCVLLGTKGFSDSSTAEVEERIAKEEYYRKIDGLCMSIPLPNDAKLLGKQGLWKIKGIQYYFKTASDKEEIFLSITSYLKSNKWNPNRHQDSASNTSFNNNIYTIDFELYPGSGSDLAIFCGTYDAENDAL